MGIGKKNDEPRKKIKLREDVWTGQHRTATEMLDFYEDRKGEYLEEYILGTFTKSAACMPIIPLQIVKSFVNQKSLIYNDSTIIDTGDTNTDKMFSKNSLKLALMKCQKHDNMYKASFFRIDLIPGKPLEFSPVDLNDIVYAFNFKRVCIRLDDANDTDDDDLSIYEYMEEQENGTVKVAEYIAERFFSINFDKIFGANGQEPYKDDEVSGFSLKRMSDLPAMPIVPMFGYSTRGTVRQPILMADLILNCMLSFGFAGAPTSLLAKIIYERKQGAGKGANEILSTITDVSEVASIRTGDKLSTLQTDQLNALNNFMFVMSGIIQLMLQLEGISRSSISVFKPARQSGASQIVDDNKSDALSSTTILELNVFEDKVFERINIFLKQRGHGEVKFEQINKNKSAFASSVQLLEENLKAVQGRMKHPVDALMEYLSLTRGEAESEYERIMEEHDKVNKKLMAEAADMSTPSVPKSKASGDAKNEYEDEKNES